MKNIRFLGRVTVVAAALFAASALPSAAAGLALDNAANYNATWTNGSNGGTGFNPWVLETFGNGSAGFFIGDSRNLAGGSGANINSAGNVSFGLYGTSEAGGTTATATRTFSGGELSVGETFSLDVAVNFRNGFKGVNLLDGGVTVFTLLVASDSYSVTDAATGNGSLGDYSSDTAFALSFTQTSGTGGTWSIIRSGGLPGGPFTGTYSGVADGFKLFVGNTDGGPPNDLFANNLAIVPEPSSACLVLAAGLLTLRRRRTGETV